MTPINKASGFHRMACGLCLLAGPALILVAAIVDPSSGGGDNDIDYLQSLKDDPGLAQLSTALWMFGFALVAIGLIGLVHVIRDRGVVLANIGGALAIFGLIMFVALVTTTINDINMAEHLDLKVADKLGDDVEDYWVGYLVFVPALLGTFLGFILLGVAVIRSKVFHMAAGILIIVGIVAIVASEDSKAMGIVANALLLGGYGLIGLKLLGMTDEQWAGRAPIGPAAPEASPAAGPPAAGPPPAAPPPAV